jgi:rhodanese-related sulfurtransferase
MKMHVAPRALNIEFPGAKNLTLKIIYRTGDGKLLGAQAVGAEGCDKRLDVIATVLHFGGTIDDLCKIDLAYAPPFGSAKDPLHMAAFVAENDLNHLPTLVEFDSELDGMQIVDVRNAGEIAQLPLAGAICIPIDELAERWTELDPQRPTVTVCHSGKRAHIAACWLHGQGFADVKNLNGGMSMRSLQVG